jgi:putative membrane protein
LLILGTPDWLVRRILRPDPVFFAARIVIHPIVAIVLFNIIFSLFHMPSLYNLSVTNHLIHIAEHLVFIGAALIMWWPLVSTLPELPRLSYPLQMMYLFGMSVAQIVVFGPVTFSQEPLYQWYVDAPRRWSVTALSDQQIGAVIMKVGGGVLFMTLLMVAFYRWYRSAEEETEPEPDSPELSLQRY